MDKDDSSCVRNNAKSIRGPSYLACFTIRQSYLPAYNARVTQISSIYLVSIYLVSSSLISCRWVSLCLQTVSDPEIAEKESPERKVDCYNVCAKTLIIIDQLMKIGNPVSVLTVNIVVERNLYSLF